MLFEILLACFVGVLAGIVSGLTPGIHINLVAALLVTYASILLDVVPALALCCFIIAMSITHTFLDNIPSVFLGAPESATALGVLPGHRYLLKGKGYTAVKLSVLGCFFGLLFSLLLFPLLIPLVTWVYPFLQPYMGYLLLLVAVFMILRDKKRLWALYIFLLSGIVGVVLFSIPNVKNPLFPLLSGMFGIATLLTSLNESERIPKQKTNQSLRLDIRKTTKAVLSGTLSGWLTALFPGLSSAIAAVISLQLTRKLGDYGFMMLTGAISTVNFSLSLVTFYALGKARNGSVIAIQALLQDVSILEIAVFVCVCLLIAGIAVWLSLRIAVVFAQLVTRVQYRVLILAVIGFIVVLTVVLSHWFGLLLLVTSTSIGLLPALQKTTRTHAMGCLLLPVILYFLL